MIASFILSVALSTAISTTERFYVSNFCAPIAANQSDAGELRLRIKVWGAKLGSDAEAEAFRPQDADAPGQMVVFADPAAPHAFVERRRGACSLVYSGAGEPEAVREEMRHHPVAVEGPDAPTTPWRRTVTKKVGPPGPIRYFLQIGGEAREGLCATVFEDLRLRDNSPAAMVRITPCRLGPEETFDNG